MRGISSAGTITITVVAVAALALLLTLRIVQQSEIGGPFATRPVYRRQGARHEANIMIAHPLSLQLRNLPSLVEIGVDNNRANLIHKRSPSQLTSTPNPT